MGMEDPHNTQLARPPIKDSVQKSLLKTISWRICATLTTITIVFIFTGHLVISLGVGVTEVIVKMILYFVHERLWERSHLK